MHVDVSEILLLSSRYTLSASLAVQSEHESHSTLFAPEEKTDNAANMENKSNNNLRLIFYFIAHIGINMWRI